MCNVYLTISTFCLVIFNLISCLSKPDLQFCELDLGSSTLSWVGFQSC